MVRKYLIFSILLLNSFNAYTFNPNEYFINEFFDFEQSLFRFTNKDRFRPKQSSLSKSLINYIIQDKDNRIDERFKITPFFKERILFWFMIYTHYTNNHSIVHDKLNLKLVYDVLNFTGLNDSPINYLVKHNMKQKFLSNKKNYFVSIFNKLKTKRSNFTYAENSILNEIKKSGYIVPSNRNSRIKFFNERIENLRFQSGQSNMIYNGLINSLKYENFLFLYLNKFNLPKELFSIPFLESSFNPNAVSRVKAKGIWQIMPNIEKALFKKNSNLSPSVNPLLSTFGALTLFRENYQILKRWDLAITAYNSGFRHIFKAKRLLRVKNPSLSYIIKHYKHPDFGFASSNFYSEFIALVYTLSYKEILFPLTGIKKESTFDFKNNEFLVYLSVCKFNPLNYINQNKLDIKTYSKINTHLKYLDKFYPKGTIFFSKKKLKTKYFVRVPEKVLIGRYPKYWKNYSRRYKCWIK